MGIFLFVATAVFADSSNKGYVNSPKKGLHSKTKLLKNVKKKKPAPRLDPWSKSYALERVFKFAGAARVIAPFRTRGVDREMAILRTAWLLYRQAKYNDSFREYWMAIQFNPNSIDARLGISLVLLAQQRWREATLHAKEVLKISPWNYTAHLRILVAEQGQRKWHRMTRHAAKLSAHYPTDTTALVYMARGFAWLSNRPAAVKAYARVLLRVPLHIEAKYYLAKNK